MILSSCDMIMQHSIMHNHTDDALVITDAKFSDDYKKLTLRLDVTKDVGNIMDSSKVDIKINDTYCQVMPIIKIAQPQLVSMKHIAPAEIKRSGLMVLALVDLTQSSSVLKKEAEYVKKLYSLFSENNLYLAFMLPDGAVSPIMLASDYIVNNYISINSPLLGGVMRSNIDITMTDVDTVAVMPQKQHAWLYKSVARMLYSFSGHTGTVLDNAKYKALVVFSDGQVYDEATNTPLDPQHFVNQEHIINLSGNMNTNTSVFYVNLASANVSNTVKDTNLMRMLCMRSKGKYLGNFNWIQLRDNMLRGFHIAHDDYVMELENPDGKIFFGSLRNLRVRVYKKGTKTLLAECNHEYYVGSITFPIIVGDQGYGQIYFLGWMLALFVMAVVYVIMQFIMPYVRYRIFHSKYVVNYTGPNMSVQGKLVADTCYFCKAPFQIGDAIVAKCQHTMHEECWNENDQHCPEYGKRCPEGSHYYDPLNIFNPRNGSYLIKWLMLAILLSTCAWFFMAWMDHSQAFNVIDAICDALKAKNDEMVDATDTVINNGTSIMSISPRMYLLPLFGLYVAPMLTFLFSGLASYHRRWMQRLGDMLLRTVMVQIVSIAIFLVEFFIVLVCDIYDGSFLFDWIPWSIVTFLIIHLSTVNTRITDVDSRTAVVVSLTMGIVNALLWNILGTYETKSQIVLFILLFIVYGIGLALVIARRLPDCDRFFLHVCGEVKEMDIALYKWLRQTPDSFVTIGRSVDCQLQISWDATSDIAPVHAVIRQHNGVPYISAVDGSVLIGNKAIDEDAEVRLHHGMSFQIGTTIFTFVEE